MKRNITISYATGWHKGARETPMLRISNRFLLGSGFKIGDKAAVTYGKKSLIISGLPPEPLSQVAR